MFLSAKKSVPIQDLYHGVKSANINFRQCFSLKKPPKFEAVNTSRFTVDDNMYKKVFIMNAEILVLFKSIKDTTFYNI